MNLKQKLAESRIYISDKEKYESQLSFSFISKWEGK